MNVPLKRLRAVVLGEPETGWFGLSLPCPKCGTKVTVPVPSRRFPPAVPRWWSRRIVDVWVRRKPHPTSNEIVGVCRVCTPERGPEGMVH